MCLPLFRPSGVVGQRACSDMPSTIAMPPQLYRVNVLLQSTDAPDLALTSPPFFVLRRYSQFRQLHTDVGGDASRDLCGAGGCTCGCCLQQRRPVDSVVHTRCCEALAVAAASCCLPARCTHVICALVRITCFLSAACGATARGHARACHAAATQVVL